MATTDNTTTTRLGQLILTIFALYGRTEGNWLSVASIVALMADLGADGQAVRSAVSRLKRRGDDPTLLAHHQAFADWMRGHARDPGHMPHVLTTGGWEGMRWERWVGTEVDGRDWSMRVIDWLPVSKPKNRKAHPHNTIQAVK